MKKQIPLLFIILVTGISLFSQGRTKVLISFRYKPQKGIGSNQFAVWIEDKRGKLVKTLFVTHFSGKRKGFNYRMDSVRHWVKKADAKNLPQNKLNAISGATPWSKIFTDLSFTWNLTDRDGKKVNPGVYHYRVEGTVRFKKTVLYTGKIRVGPSLKVMPAKIELFPKSESFKQDMITRVKAVVK